jgi:hypothetical protein
MPHTERASAIVMIRLSVRILAAIWCEQWQTGQAEYDNAGGHRAADPRARVPSIPPTSANAVGSPVMRTAAVERVVAKADRFAIGGMTPGRQATHRCG